MIQREEALPTHGGQERLDVTIPSMKKQGILTKRVWKLLHLQTVKKLILATECIKSCIGINTTILGLKSCALSKSLESSLFDVVSSTLVQWCVSRKTVEGKTCLFIELSMKLMVALTKHHTPSQSWSQLKKCRGFC